MDSSDVDPVDPVDPVRARRAQWARVATAGQRVGYALILVAIVAFIGGAAAGFSDATTAIVAASLGGATLTLAPAMVIGYAVKAAEREDRAQGR